MTVSLPVTLPAPATAGKAGSAAPGKGIMSAPGQTTTGGPGGEAAEVADMFAALVAAVMQQMQPVDAVAQNVAEEQVVEGDGQGVKVTATDTKTPVFVPPVLGAGDGADVDVVIDAAGDELALVPDAEQIAGDTDVENADAAAEPTEDIEPAADITADAVDESGDGDGDDAARTVDQSRRGGSVRAPDGAHAAADPDDATEADRRPAPPSGVTPATPAQPAAGAGPATPAVPASPAAKGADGEVPTVAGLPNAPVTVAPTAPAQAAAPVATPAPAADAHVQIARVVRPLRLGNDGAYELALDLTPAELGRVRIDVELRGTTINLHLRADNPATRELLQGSLDQLRAELESAGLEAGSLDIGGHGADDHGAPDDEAAATGPVFEDTAPAATETSGSAALDNPIDTDADAGVDILA